MFGLLVVKLSQSPDAVVRATCSFALGLLLKSSNPHIWTVAHVDRADSARGSQDQDPNVKPQEI